MNTPLRPVVTACLLTGVALLLYYSPGSGPLSVDERVFADRAASVSGQRQFFFHVEDERWLQPMAVYAAAVVRAAGGGENSGRLASSVIGAVDVGLIFLAAFLLLRNYWLGIGCAFLLMAMPAHWLFARLGTDAVFATPFVILWLIAMLRFLETDSSRALAGAGVALGAGVYAHPTAPLTMACLWLLSLYALSAAHRLSSRNLALVTVSWMVLLVPLAVYFAFYPETYPDTFGRWAVLKAHLRFPLDGVRAQMNWTTLGNRASLFWGLLDPSFLLFAQDAQRMAPVLIASALLLPLGVARAWALRWPVHRVMVLGTLLVPPMVASTFGVAHDLSAVVPMTVGLALLSAAGIDWLTTGAVGWKVAGAASLLTSAYQLLALR